MNTYILMETVDLGGHPVKGFLVEQKAKEALLAANAAYKAQKIKNLMAHCNYTLEQAERFVANQTQFYLETVEVE